MLFLFERCFCCFSLPATPVSFSSLPPSFLQLDFFFHVICSREEIFLLWCSSHYWPDGFLPLSLPSSSSCLFQMKRCVSNSSLRILEACLKEECCEVLLQLMRERERERERERPKVSVIRNSQKERNDASSASSFIFFLFLLLGALALQFSFYILSFFLLIFSLGFLPSVVSSLFGVFGKFENRF